MLAAGGSTLRAEEPSPADPPVAWVVRLPEPLLRQVIRRQVDRKTRIDRVLFEARVVGSAHTTGQIDVALRAGDDDCQFHLTFRGETVSKTVSFHGPARIYCERVTPFVARSEVCFDGRHFTHAPAEVRIFPGQLKEQVESVSPGLRGLIVRSVAQRRVERLRADTEAVAQSDAKHHVAESLNEAVTRHLARLNRYLRIRRYASVLWAPSPTHWRFRTTDDHLQISFGRDPESHMDLPAARAATLQIWLHNSLLGAKLEERLSHWAGLGPAVCELMPAADRPLVRTCCWLAERLIQLRVEAHSHWVLVEAQPPAWLRLARVSSSLETFPDRKVREVVEAE